VLLAGRLIACCVYMYLCVKLMPGLWTGISVKGSLIMPLISFGGWVTLSNLISPFLATLDRFLIGAFISIEAVAYYVIPFEVVIKLMIIPGALIGVFFPAFSVSFAQDRSRTTLLFSQGTKFIYLLLFPLVLLIITLAEGSLNLWLGAKFAHNSTRVLQWLAIGVFINSLSQVPFSLLQGAGRPDLPAKVNLLEVPFYLLILWWLIKAHGIEGAAIAFVVRMGIDAAILFGLACGILKINGSVKRQMVAIMAVTLFILALGFVQMHIGMKTLFMSLTLSTFPIATWFIILTPDEKVLMRANIKKLLPFNL
jgi:O-antigen/teichoic acid export membrane protein